MQFSGFLLDQLYSNDLRDFNAKANLRLSTYSNWNFFFYRFELVFTVKFGVCWERSKHPVSDPDKPSGIFIAITQVFFFHRVYNKIIQVLILRSVPSPTQRRKIPRHFNLFPAGVYTFFLIRD